MYRLPFVCALAAIFALLFGCVESESPTTQSTAPAAFSGRLTGAPNSPAVNAVFDYDGGDRTTDDEITVDADGTQVDRTNIDITFEEVATVAEINAVLDSILGTIVSMLDDVNVILVKIPDPMDLATLDGIIATLELDPMVVSVDRATMYEPNSLPANYDWLVSNLAPIDHQIAIRAPAAWNATKALSYSSSSQPLLLVADFFGDGTPNSDFDTNFLQTADFGSGNPHSHGHHVLGIMTGLHTQSPTATTPRDLVTGVLPTTYDVRVADLRTLNTLTAENKMIRVIRNSGRRLVVNTSLGTSCGVPPLAACARRNALRWLRKVRGAATFATGQPGALESNFIQLTAAGNFAGSPDTTTAVLTSSWTAGRLMSGLTVRGAASTPVANLTNTLVVENRTNSTAPHIPSCLHSTSKFPGEISAIGHAVNSFTGANAGVGNQTGTSMATPQAAAVAALVWTVAPSLSPQDVMEILLKTARTIPGDAGCVLPPTPVVDAYSALLATDNASALEFGTGDPLKAPVRLAVLDVLGANGADGNNMKFDHHDLERFIFELEMSAGFNLDYSRYDLNGDGYTGGAANVVPFNLDMDSEVVIGDVLTTLHGQLVTMDETIVSDWDILCYYSYSSMYTGDAAFRDTLLASYVSDCGVPLGDDLVLYTEDVQPFGAGNFEVFEMNSLGGNETQLTSTPQDDYSGVYSPDLTEIAFLREQNSDIWVMGSDGSTPTNLIGDAAPNEHDDIDPQWSPDGSKILYLRTRNPGTSGFHHVWVMDASGMNKRRLAPDDDVAPESDPVWSPDGSKVAFASTRGSTDWEIYVINTDGSGLMRLTDDDLGYTNRCDRGPQWSPGGSTIYFVSDRAINPDFTYRFDIFSMNADGTGPVNLTNTVEDEEDISLSPDGTKIAYTRRVAGVEDVYVIPSDGGMAVNILNNPNSFFTPMAPLLWSPESSQVMFSFHLDIHVANADGTFLNNITNDQAGRFPTDWRQK